MGTDETITSLSVTVSLLRLCSGEVHPLGLILYICPETASRVRAVLAPRRTFISVTQQALYKRLLHLRDSF